MPVYLGKFDRVACPPWDYGVHPAACWSGEPARGRWARRARDEMTTPVFWRAGQIGKWTWELTFTRETRDITWIFWRRCPEARPEKIQSLRGHAVYRTGGEWAFAALTKTTAYRYGGVSPYGAGPEDVAMMVMRP